MREQLSSRRRHPTLRRHDFPVEPKALSICDPDIWKGCWLALLERCISSGGIGRLPVSGQTGSIPFSISRFFVTMASPLLVETSMPVAQTARHSSS